VRVLAVKLPSESPAFGRKCTKPVLCAPPQRKRAAKLRREAARVCSIFRDEGVKPRRAFILPRPKQNGQPSGVSRNAGPSYGQSGRPRSILCPDRMGGQARKTWPPQGEPEKTASEETQKLRRALILRPKRMGGQAARSCWIAGRVSRTVSLRLRAVHE
jgi:hypothetical protein